jgi:hypothetical protein
MLFLLIVQNNKKELFSFMAYIYYMTNDINNQIYIGKTELCNGGRT